MVFDPTSFKKNDIQDKMAQAQQKLAEITAEGQAGAGEYSVKVTLNGRYEATKVIIDQPLMQESAEVVSDLVASAITDAAHKAEVAIQMEMMKLFQGMDLPK